MTRPTRNVLVRFVSVLLAAICALSVGAALAAPPQAPSNHNATRADFDQLMKELSNWGRWGKDDQMGAVNLITPAKRKEAVRAVKDGVSVSMARNAEIEPAIDNPRPINRVMNPRRGGDPGSPPPDISGASDTYTDLLSRPRPHAHGRVLPPGIQGPHVQRHADDGGHRQGVRTRDRSSRGRTASSRAAC